MCNWILCNLIPALSPVWFEVKCTSTDEEICYSCLSLAMLQYNRFSKSERYSNSSPVISSKRDSNWIWFSLKAYTLSNLVFNSSKGTSLLYSVTLSKHEFRNKKCRFYSIEFLSLSNYFISLADIVATNYEKKQISEITGQIFKTIV